VKLLVLCPSAAYGGAERYAVIIASAARRQGFAVRAAVPYGEPTQELVDAFHTNDVTTVDLRPAGPGPRVRRLTGGTLRLVRLIRRFRPDVVHLTLPWPTAGFPELLTCACLRTPTVVVFALVPDWLELGRRVRLYRWSRQRRQAWVAVSEHGRRVLAEALGTPVEALHRIYNGIPPRDHTSSGGAMSAKRSLGLPDSSTLVLSVGRLNLQKGHVDLLAAFARLGAAYPDLHAVIAGEGPERERLEKLIRSHGLENRIHLLGEVANVPELMRAADLFIFPSHFEGTPAAMLEAMAYGVPVIAARFRGVEEVIEDGQSGLLVPVEDPDVLADRIAWAVGHGREIGRMAERAQHRAAQFSQSAMVEQTLELISGLSQGRPAPESVRGVS